MDLIQSGMFRVVVIGANNEEIQLFVAGPSAEGVLDALEEDVRKNVKAMEYFTLWVPKESTKK